MVTLLKSLIPAGNQILSVLVMNSCYKEHYKDLCLVVNSSEFGTPLSQMLLLLIILVKVQMRPNTIVKIKI